ncbi:CD63 antigen-like [Bubalus kerabau]|uniref:CD63 antigen-like n=1 Tax=Bubalus carabanensis TaxID=3119969 RepID=UPI00244E670E|nr:CD63 antigen-like [Bubalus carabanensis]
MVVEGGMKCVKALLYVLLVTCCICAVGLIAVGLGAKLDLNQTTNWGATPESLAPVVIIAMGVCLFLVAFVGCYGAWKKDYCLMIMLAICLSLIMLAEVVAVVAGYMLKDKVMMQEHFKCCRAANYTDREYILLTTKQIPGSYYVSITKGCGINFSIKEMHAESCVVKTGGWLRSKVVIATGLSIAFMEVLGIVFACCLVKVIRRGYDDVRGLVSSARLNRGVG